MWAFNLLKFEVYQHGIWTTRQGFLQVFPDRMTRSVDEKIDPIHIIDPANARFVDPVGTFQTRVTESGWVWNSQRLFDDQLPNEQLEKILVRAEDGEQPASFDGREFVKIEPGHTGKLVKIVKFEGIDDSVAVDILGKCLLGRSTQDLLSEKRWVSKTLS